MAETNVFTSEIPTNDENIDKMMKIMNTALYSTGFGDSDLAEETSEITESIMTDIQTQQISPDMENMGFFEVKIESGNMVIDSYSKLNFDSESGFSIRPDFSSEKKVFVEHDGFRTIMVNGKQMLTARKADTLNIVVEGLEATALTDQDGNNILYLKNKYTKLTDLEDVKFSEDKESSDLLMIKDNKLTDVDLDYVTEIPPSRIRGGEF